VVSRETKRAKKTKVAHFCRKNKYGGLSRDKKIATNRKIIEAEP